MLRTEEMHDKIVWDGFVQNSKGQFTPFFQSWDWGEVQERLSHDIFRLGFFNQDKLEGVLLGVLIRARRGTYLHLRHGPLLSNFQEQFDDILPTIKDLAKKNGAHMIRMSPLLERDVFDSGFFKKRGFRNAPIHNMDAENTWVLDLEKSEEELLQGMRKTTRYLVRKAQGMNIEISNSSEESDFREFMNLYVDTSKRHKFVPHKGVEEEFNIFSKNKYGKLFLARYDKKVIAGALIVYYGNQAVYHHAASSYEYREIPAAYLMQWEIIKDAKKEGKKLYNFWGVVPPEKPNHPWQGLTLFKTGFGGRRLNFIHAQDLPLSPFYLKTFAIESAWRIKRGY